MRYMRALLRGSFPVVFATLSISQAAGQTELFRETFDEVATPQDSNGGAGGGVPQGQFAAGPVGTTGWTFDLKTPNQSDVRFGFNYSDDPGTSFDFGIPEAPNTQPGDVPFQGVALRTNVSTGPPDQAAIFYEDAAFTGRYQVQVDMYLQWSADAASLGTTEHGGLFIGSGTAENPASPDFPGSNGAGAIFSSDGDTLNFDHALLKNNIYPTLESGQYSVTEFGSGNQLGYDDSDVNTDAANGDLLNLAELLPAIDLGGGNVQRAGVVGYRWVTIKADVDTEALGTGGGTETGLTTFSVEIAETGESYTLGTLDNSVIDDLEDGPVVGFDDETTDQGPVDMAGRVTLTLIDFFEGSASNINLASVIFDNLIVTALPVPLEGDYNSDGKVDAADYTVYRDTLGSTSDLRADGNGNGAIETADLAIWSDNFGAVASSSIAVPEPATLAGCLIALLALAGHRRDV